MHVQVDEPFEEIVWNQRGFPKPSFFKAMKAIQPETLTLKTRGFVLTGGDCGHVLIGPVHHNGDVYRRTCQRRGNVYGSVRLLIQFDMQDAKLLSEAELIDVALTRPNYKHVVRDSDGLQLDVAMLFDWPTKQIPRSCGIYLTPEGVNAFNPELPSSSKNTPHVRYKESAIQPFEIEPLLKYRKSLLCSAALSKNPNESV